MNIVPKVLLKSIVVNIFLVITKLIIGIIGSSKSLVANAIHSLSDLTTDIIAIAGSKISSRPADTKHPYGYGQIEYLTSIIMGTIILCLGFNEILNAFTNISTVSSNIIIITCVITIITKYILSLYIFKEGKKYKNSILIVSGIEAKADALTNAFVLIAAILSKLTPYNELYKYSDNVCTFIIGVYIIYIAIRILRENIANIIDTTERDNELLEKLKTSILKNTEVKEIKDLSLIKYGSYYTANLEIAINASMKLKEVEKIKQKIKRSIVNKRTRVAYLTISITPYERK